MPGIGVEHRDEQQRGHGNVKQHPGEEVVAFTGDDTEVGGDLTDGDEG